MTTNPCFTHGIDKMCTICHVILKDTNGTHSIFSTVEEMEYPMNVLQVLQSFSNFTFYNGPEMVCTSCYVQAIKAYKFIQMCNNADKNMQHYLKDVEAKPIKDETDVDVKVEEIGIAYSRIITNERELIEETENEKISKFDEVGMVFSGTQIKIEDRILKDGLEPEEIKTIKDETDVDVTFEEIFIAPGRFIIDGREFVEEMENEKISKFDTSNNEESTISHTEIVTVDETDSSNVDNFRVEIIDEQIHDERMGFNKCKDCHLVFSDKKELGDHRKEAKHNKEKPLNTHIHVHSGDSRNEVKVKAHKCEQCGRRFNQAGHLQSHMDRHNGVKAYKCEQCERRFTLASDLRRHMIIHSGVKRHKCGQCDREFTLAATLRTHMDIHSGLKPHKCEECDRQFTQAAHLRTHMGIHNGVKTHKCEQCDRRFIQAGNLRSHMDRHNGVKAHKCEQCDRRFTLASDLRRHMDIHSGVKAHKCEHCDRQFTLPSSLRKHMMTHIRKFS